MWRFEISYEARYKRFQGEKVRKTLVLFVAWVSADAVIVHSEHGDHQWIAWDPPHAIQENTVDPLLADVAEKLGDNLQD